LQCDVIQIGAFYLHEKLRLLRRVDLVTKHLKMRGGCRTSAAAPGRQTKAFHQREEVLFFFKPSLSVRPQSS
jgi:hypothetical protein